MGVSVLDRGREEPGPGVIHEVHMQTSPQGPQRPKGCTRSWHPPHTLANRQAGRLGLVAGGAASQMRMLMSGASDTNLTSSPGAERAGKRG